MYSNVLSRIMGWSWEEVNKTSIACAPGTEDNLSLVVQQCYFVLSAKSKTRQRYTVTRVPSIMDQTKLNMKASFKAYSLHELKCFFLHSGSPCDINHKPIHGIMNTKCGLWIFGNPLYQSTSFVKNEKWPGPKRCWTNRPFPHNARRRAVVAVMTL